MSTQLTQPTQTAVSQYFNTQKFLQNTNDKVLRETDVSGPKSDGARAASSVIRSTVSDTHNDLEITVDNMDSNNAEIEVNVNNTDGVITSL